MTYDHWKTTNPDDEWLGPKPDFPSAPSVAGAEPAPAVSSPAGADLPHHLRPACPYCNGTGMARGYLCAPCDGFGYADGADWHPERAGENQ